MRENQRVSDSVRRALPGFLAAAGAVALLGFEIADKGWAFFFQITLNGITLGAVYALIALGYTMIYGILKLLNFAHGDVYMVGALREVQELQEARSTHRFRCGC